LLHVYLAALGFGGTLVLASLLLGDRDSDASADADAGVDAGGDVGHDLGHDADSGADASHDVGGHTHGHDGPAHGDVASGLTGGAWLLVRSFRFWTFVLAFGGLVGTLLTWSGAAGTLPVAGASGGVGFLAGAASVWAMRAVGRGAASSDIDENALAGATATVLVAVPPGGVGKVRLDAKGRVIDLLAETEDEAALPIGAEVLVIGGSHDGRVMVTRNPS